NRAGLGRKFGECQVVGRTKLLLPLGRAKDAPAFGCDPVNAGDVGRGKDAVDLEQLGEALRPCRVGDDALARAVLLQLDPGKHFAANGFVANPIDEAAELRGFDDVRKAKKEGADAFDVHAESIDVAYCYFLSGVPSFYLSFPKGICVLLESPKLHLESDGLFDFRCEKCELVSSLSSAVI